MAGVIVIVFFIFSLLPSDPAHRILGQRTDQNSVAVITRDFALDQPVYFQFLIYLNDLSPISVYNRKEKESPIYLDPAKYRNAFKMFYFMNNKAVVFKQPYLRRSFRNRENVYDMLKDRFDDSAMLVGAAVFLASVFGVFLGLLSAIKRKTWVGKTVFTLSLAGISLPVFFIAILVAWLFGFVLHRYTGLSMTGGLYTIDPFEGEYINWKNLILPAIVLSIRPMSLIIQQTRNSFINVMSQPYILTAKAKGVRRSMIIFNHAWLNATAPLMILTRKWLGSLLAATLFVEFVFGWNGIGRLAVNAIDDGDVPVLMGIVILIGAVYIFLNLLSEIIYRTLDPRADLKIEL